jgi:thioredoxin
MDVSTDTFQRDVIERSKERPVVVDFWAEWCGPCRTLTPVLEREVAAREDKVELAKVDVDANQELAARYQVQGIPAVKAFRNGKVVSEFVGARPPAAVASFLDELTGPSPVERALAELRETGDAPDVLGALEDGDYEHALELLLSEVERNGDEALRERSRRLMITLFDQLGQDDPVAMKYRRRLATLLF